jgi:amidase
MSYETDNALFGPTLNPHDASRSAGGSSGGAAAALATGLTPLEVGSDTAGSIRIPAHFCGVAGLKASAGRIPCTGYAGWKGTHLASVTQVGPMARTVADLALALTILAGPDGADPHAHPVSLGDPATIDVRTLRVGVVRDNGIDPPSAEVLAALGAAAEALGGAGATVADATLPGLDRAPDLLSRIIVGDGGAWIGRALEAVGTTEHTFGPIPFREPTPTADYVVLLEERNRLRAEMLAAMSGWDVLLCPVTADVAPPLGTAGTAARPPGFTYTHPFNLTGWPVVVVRVGTGEGGLPIGIQVVAGPWRDDVALAAARVVERELGGPALPTAA